MKLDGGSFLIWLGSIFLLAVVSTANANLIDNGTFSVDLSHWLASNRQPSPPPPLPTPSVIGELGQGLAFTGPATRAVVGNVTTDVINYTGWLTATIVYTASPDGSRTTVTTDVMGTVTTQTMAGCASAVTYATNAFSAGSGAARFHCETPGYLLLTADTELANFAAGYQVTYWLNTGGGAVNQPQSFPLFGLVQGENFTVAQIVKADPNGDGWSEYIAHLAQGYNLVFGYRTDGLSPAMLLADVTVMECGNGINCASIPEPGTLALLCLGLAALRAARQPYTSHAITQQPCRPSNN